MLNRRRIIYGVGHFDAVHTMNKDLKRLKSYSVWHGMLRRCYGNDPKHRTYTKCKVCEDWLSFSNFEKWFNLNYREGYQLDKDILHKGNTEYAPNRCCFVPQEINLMFVKHSPQRGLFPIGVTQYGKQRGKYVARLRVKGKHLKIGVCDTPEEAFGLYKAAKEEHIKDTAHKYFKTGKITKRVFEAMKVYAIDITD